MHGSPSPRQTIVIGARVSMYGAHRLPRPRYCSRRPDKSVRYWAPWRTGCARSLSCRSTGRCTKIRGRGAPVAAAADTASRVVQSSCCGCRGGVHTGGNTVLVGLIIWKQRHWLEKHQNDQRERILKAGVVRFINVVVPSAMILKFTRRSYSHLRTVTRTCRYRGQVIAKPAVVWLSRCAKYPAASHRLIGRQHDRRNVRHAEPRVFHGKSARSYQQGWPRLRPVSNRGQSPSTVGTRSSVILSNKI